MVLWFLYCVIANNKVNISVLLADLRFQKESFGFRLASSTINQPLPSQERSQEKFTSENYETMLY